MPIFLILFFALVPAFAQQSHYEFSLDQDRLGGAPDFSRLNQPLGPADRIFIRDGHFHRVGADLRPHTGDDERRRFFGVNLAFGANFPEASDAPRIARRLRRLGVNLVRLHHMDSSPDRDPEAARSILTTGPYPTLNQLSAGRLRLFLNELKAQGIYANLNLHVGYLFRPAVDGIPPLPQGQEMPRQSKPLHIFFPRMVELQTEFTRRVIEALKLKGNPVLAMVEIDNESSLVEAWQRGNLERAALGAYRKELERQWNSFLKRRYPSAAALRAAWGGDLSEETYRSGAIPPVGNADAGPAKRVEDYLLFLCEKDRDYLRRLRDAVRSASDGLVPVAGTQMGYGGLLNLDTHQDLDYQDNHFYIDHYNFPNVRWDGHDWRIRDTSSVGSGLATFLNMAAAREAGRPYTVSEYNQPWPNRQAAEIDPALAAFAAFQDWDAIIHFAYEHGRNWDGKVPSGFNINGDLTKFPNIGQSAWLFRSGAVRPGQAPVTIRVTREQALLAAREKRIGNVAPALAALTGYDPALALLHPVAIARGESAALPAAAQTPLSAPYRSDTAELLYDPDGKILLIQAPKVAGIFGFLGAGNKVTAGDVGLELGREARGFVTLLLTALDDQPLRTSARMLVSLPGSTVGSVPGSEPSRPQRLVPYRGDGNWWTLEADPGSTRPSGSRDGGVPPVWMERVECFLSLKSAAKQITVYPLDHSGRRLKALGPQEVTPEEGGFRIHLQAEGRNFAPWYEVVQ